MNIEKRVVLIHFAGEHATKFQRSDFFFHDVEIFDHRLNAVLIFFFNRHVEQLARLDQTFLHALQSTHNLFKAGAILAEFLCAFRIIPDVRLFQLALDFVELLFLYIKVKDTP